MCYPWVKLNHPSRNHAQYSRVFPCPLHRVYSVTIALYSHKNYLLPCIVFVLPYIPVPFYISPLLPLYRLCTPIYPRTLLHIPSTPLYRLCTPIYPRAFLPTPSTPLYRPCTLINPYGFLHILSTSFFLSSYNTLNKFAGQRSRKFLCKITEQAILSSW